MENLTEKIPISVSSPSLGEETEIGIMHKLAWIETYTNLENKADQEVINNLLEQINTEEGNSFRRNLIIENNAFPENVFYRIVKNNNGKIVGFIHCTKEETYNGLWGLYLLDEAKDTGVGGKLIDDFLVWADKTKPCQLEVLATNDKAIRFYAKYGFLITDKQVEQHEDKLDLLIMVRPAEIT